MKSEQSKLALLRLIASESYFTAQQAIAFIMMTNSIVYDSHKEGQDSRFLLPVWSEINGPNSQNDVEPTNCTQSNDPELQTQQIGESSASVDMSTSESKNHSHEDIYIDRSVHVETKKPILNYDRIEVAACLLARLAKDDETQGIILCFTLITKILSLFLFFFWGKEMKRVRGKGKRRVMISVYK